MSHLLLQICGVSVLCGLAMGLTPEGAIRRLLSLCCALLLLLPILRAAGSFDLSQYRLELARYRQLEHELTVNAEERAVKLGRRAAEDACAAYVLSRAESLELPVSGAEVSVAWDPEGVWIPKHVRIRASLSAEQLARLEEVLMSELGLGPEDVEVVEDG